MTGTSDDAINIECELRGTVMERRVVVTGIGALVPGAMNAEELWKRVREGKSAIENLETVDTSGLPTNVGGEIRSFDPADFMESRLARKMDRYAQLSVSSAILACHDAAVDQKILGNLVTGVFEGSSFGPLVATLNCHRAYVTNECGGISPHLLMTSMMGSGSGFISLVLGTHGPVTTVSDGSASSTCAIGYAFRQIKSGHIDFALAGGSEAPLSREIIATFCSARLLSKCCQEPSNVVKPFDRDRDGFVISEGAVFLFLESLEHALLRNVRIYAEIAGFGETADAYHPTSPHPDGTWIGLAMKSALREACLDASDVQYINAHGTATKINDVVESKAIRSVFGNQADNISVSSTKPITSHLLGASGAVESAVVAMSIKNRFAPGTASLINPDPECPLSSLAAEGESILIHGAMNNNYSFGGRNASIVFRSLSQDKF